LPSVIVFHTSVSGNGVRGREKAARVCCRLPACGMGYGSAASTICSYSARI